jgi:hypothetical protein
VLVVAVAVGSIAWAMNRDLPAAAPSSTTSPSGSVSSVTTTPPPTTPSTSPSTTVATTQAPVDADDAWSSLQEEQPSGTVFSDVRTDGTAPVAVSANGSNLDVWSFNAGAWATTASIALPDDVDTDSSIEPADVTSDGNDDFVVTMADSSGDQTGAVVSRVGGSWDLVSFRDPGRGEVSSVIELQVQRGDLVSTSADCGLACDSGNKVDLTWRYDKLLGLFTVSNTSAH